jgi:hypothetical protein
MHTTRFSTHSSGTAWKETEATMIGRAVLETDERKEMEGPLGISENNEHKSPSDHS